MPTININSIPDNAQVYITGTVDYSHIATKIEGAELDADNARKVAKGMRAIDKPHTRMTISNAVINYGDPNNKTIAEQYVEEKMYTSPDHPEKGTCFMALNKSKNYPELYSRENNISNVLENIVAEGELSVGTNVTLMVRFFSTKQNKGMSLDAVIVNAKNIRWNMGGNSAVANGLLARGFQIANSAPVDEVRSQLAANTAPVQPAPMALQPAPMAQPAPAPVAPAPAPYMQAPVQPVPTAQPTAVPPAPVAPAPAPVQPAAPTPAPSLPIPPKGYVYDENGRIVPEAQRGGIKL